MNHLTPDFIAWAAFALAMGVGLMVMGWVLGLSSRDQEHACNLSHVRTQLAIAQEMLRRSRQHCAERTEELHVADARIRHLQECNRQLAAMAVEAEEYAQQQLEQQEYEQLMAELAEIEPEEVA